MFLTQYNRNSVWQLSSLFLLTFAGLSLFLNHAETEEINTPLRLIHDTERHMGKIKLTCLAISVIFAAMHFPAEAEPFEDRQALLDFIFNINHSPSVNWDVRTSACTNWIGVTCNHDSSRIIALRLPSSGLTGTIPRHTLDRLSSLQILSLASNNISGVFPIALYKLRNLTGLYLPLNRFEGPLPYNFSVWPNLSVLNLSYNRFDGIIPSSILNLSRLTVLDLANNSLSGDIPDLNISSLQKIDLSNNNLSGVLPKSLMWFPGLSFAGNNLTFPRTVSLPPAQPPMPSPRKRSSKFSESAILGIVIGSCAAAFVSIAFLLIVMNRKNKKETNETTTNTALHKRGKSSAKMGSEHQDGSGKLVFFEGRNLIFDLEDLLRASAEVLGKGTFGTTYRAALEDATSLAVKRLREVAAGKREFEQQMELVGSIRHENVAPLRAYYYSKEEKLMVYDYYSLGSVSALLHDKRGENRRTPLDWETRLNIALGAAKGISCIHSQSNGRLIHGNIKSSNIFLNSQNISCIADLGLATLTGPPSARPMTRIGGYRAPEVTDAKRATQASDIYSLGVVLLELLSGKSPVQIPGGGGGGGDEIVHLVRWVQSVVREEWTGEVFDVELLRYPNVEEEMVSMLQIGLSCVSRLPGQRPTIGEVVRTIEEIRGGVAPASISPGDGNGSP